MRSTVALGIFVLTFTALASSAQDCIVYEDYMHWVGAGAFEGIARDVCVSGHYAYLACDAWGLRVLDIADPAAPIDLGAIETPGAAYKGSVAGGRLYLADGWGGLCVYDLGEPEAPVHLATVDVGGFAEAVSVTGDIACVAVNGVGLRVVDVSDPQWPQLGGLMTLPITPWDVATRIGFAYLPASWQGQSVIYVVRILTPDLPQLVATLPTPGQANAIEFQGSYAYVGDSGGGLMIWDISAPFSPTLVSTLPGVNARDLSVKGPVATLISSGRGMVAVDVSNPALPQLMGHVNTLEYTTGIALSAGYAFVSEYTGLLDVIDVSHLESSNPVAQLPIVNYLFDITISGDRAYVTSYNHYDYYWSILHVLDISAPDQPVHLGSRQWILSSPRDLAATGDRVHFLDSDKLRVLDTSAPGNIVELGSWGSGAPNFSAFAMAGDLAFLADANHGLWVLDTSDPAAISSVSDLETPGGATRIALSGDLACLAEGNGNLLVIDVSDPASPQQLGSTPLASTVTLSMLVAWQHLFVLSAPYNLQVFDISTPASPVLQASKQIRAGSYYSGSDYGDMRFQFPYLYIADGNGMLMLDMSDPSVPTIAGCLDPASNSNGIDLSDDYAFLISTQSLYVLPLHCVDLTAVDSPAIGAGVSLLGSYPNPFNPHGSIVFSLDHARRLSLDIYDISGRLLRSLLDGVILPEGRQEIHWDGRDDAGRDLVSGVYLYELRAGRIREAGKTVLLR